MTLHAGCMIHTVVMVDACGVSEVRRQKAVDRRQKKKTAERDSSSDEDEHTDLSDEEVEFDDDDFNEAIDNDDDEQSGAGFREEDVQFSDDDAGKLDYNRNNYYYGYFFKPSVEIPEGGKIKLGKLYNSIGHPPGGCLQQNSPAAKQS